MDTRAHWQQVYSSRAADEVSWYQAEPAVSLALIEASGIGREAPVIDVGGGASVLVDRLLDLGYTRPAVLDIAERALEAARRRLGRRAESVEWFAEDVREFRPPHSFELWHDRAVFHFLVDAADRARYVATLKAALERDGHVVIATFGPEGPEQCSGLPVVRYDEQRLAAVLGESFQLLDSRDEIHVTPGGREQAFRYFRLRRSE
ncbi:class I SAM-dependent methyltransferase [Ectothiorhodospiraceae bacterium WFHF3C12]|nr:class I SAM-dependent methyltransferase [Ectothiorhodospiraceae bacterium WFHF3C12]